MKKRIVFVSPPITGEERYGPVARGGVYMPPLGLAWLAAVARQQGYEAHIIDSEVLGLGIDGTVRETLDCRPDYIAFTAATMSVEKAAIVAEQIKLVQPNLPIILGGSHVTPVPEETMERFPAFDIGIIGEGEDTIAELLPALDDRAALDAIPGLIVRHDGELCRTPARRFIMDLDKLPFPAWDLLPDLATHYRPSAFGFQRLPCSSLLTSRGCPSRCSFCEEGPWGMKYREHSAQYTFDMMQVLHQQYGINDLCIYDGTFGVRQSRLVELCEMLSRADMDLVWSANARVPQIDAEIVQIMKDAGCWGLAFGVETGSPEVLAFLQKGFDHETIRRAITCCKEHGLMVKGYTMVGTLSETRESIQQTLDFVLSVDLDLITVNHFTPLPGTLDYDRADEFGEFNQDWNKLNEHAFVFKPNSLTQQEIEEAIRLITRRFYLRPHILWRYLKMACRPRYFRLLWSGALAFAEFLMARPERDAPTPEKSLKSEGSASEQAISTAADKALVS